MHCQGICSARYVWDCTCWMSLSLSSIHFVGLCKTVCPIQYPAWAIVLNQSTKLGFNEHQKLRSDYINIKFVWLI